MPASRYNAETASVICDAIATNGLDEAGWKAASISKGTFYRWLNERETFRDAVNTAKAEYQKSHYHSLRRSANKALADYLTGSMCKVERTVTIHPDGSQTEQIKTIPVGIPRWAIERVLGSQVSEVDAVLNLVMAGFIPEWIGEYAINIIEEFKAKLGAAIRGQIPESELQRYIASQEGTGKADGISDETYNEIRAKIMGIT